MRTAITIIIALSFCFSVSVCAGSVTANPAAVAQLKKQSDAWDQAIIHKDRAAIEANMADDFRHIDGAGNVSMKKTFVDDLVAPDVQIDPYTVEDFDVRLLGNDVALLGGRTHMTGHEGGKAFETTYRYIDIYVRRDGVWKVVNVQITKIPK